MGLKFTIMPKAKVDISKIDPAELEKMKALVAKLQGQGQDALAKAEAERRLKTQKEQEEINRRRKLTEEASKNGLDVVTGNVTEGKATHVFLDDKRTPTDVTWVPMPEGVTWRVIKTFVEFKEYIEKNGVPKHVSFDHDLQPKATTGQQGTDAAKWLKKYCKEQKLKMPEWTAHSQTITGRQSIENILL